MGLITLGLIVASFRAAAPLSLPLFFIASQQLMKLSKYSGEKMELGAVLVCMFEATIVLSSRPRVACAGALAALIGWCSAQRDDSRRPSMTSTTPDGSTGSCIMEPPLAVISSRILVSAGDLRWRDAQRIVEAIVDTVRPDRIILFGSGLHPQSTLDRLRHPRAQARVGNRRRAGSASTCARTSRSVDIIVRADHVDQYRDAPQFLYAEALRGILYER